jgi:hypothetical protein
MATGGSHHKFAITEGPTFTAAAQLILALVNDHTATISGNTSGGPNADFTITCTATSRSLT